MVGSHVARERLVEMVRELNNDNKVLSDAVERDGKWRKRGYALIATSIILAMGVAGGVWWGYQERENNSSLRAEVASHNTVLAQKDSRVGELEKEVPAQPVVLTYGPASFGFDHNAAILYCDKKRAAVL
mgnify:CR=1 FL=1